MNAKQMDTWKELVRQCKSRLFGSINIASNVRSDAILAADALVELITPELMGLLERLATFATHARIGDNYDYQHWHSGQYNTDIDEARALAALIREALEGGAECTN